MDVKVEASCHAQLSQSMRTVLAHLLPPLTTPTEAARAYEDFFVKLTLAVLLQQSVEVVGDENGGTATCDALTQLLEYIHRGPVIRVSLNSWTTPEQLFAADGPLRRALASAANPADEPACLLCENLASAPAATQTTLVDALTMQRVSIATSTRKKTASQRAKTTSASVRDLLQERVVIDLPRPVFLIAHVAERGSACEVAKPLRMRCLFQLRFVDTVSATAESVLNAKLEESSSSIEKRFMVMNGHIASVNSLYADAEVLAYARRVLFELRSRFDIRRSIDVLASEALEMAVRGLAALEERGFVTPSDVKVAAVDVLSHRVFTSDPPMYGEERTSTFTLMSRVSDSESYRDMIASLLRTIPVPV